jgi:hypothetical protein
MTIYSIIAGVHLAAGKPAVEWGGGVIQDRVPFFVPVNVSAALPQKASGSSTLFVKISLYLPITVLHLILFFDAAFKRLHPHLSDQHLGNLLALKLHCGSQGKLLP